ncbi:non-specific lipid-transfer protein 1-like [Macadamia integrifolia]|uniref:non-specific lipid-transfer protein 1-like n=1 Tax=Macadamia integrifolia TaxID=60698 RepID=UPI001C4FCE04|nr:non-specific lipid-transfer protein 1-like [Macadamia integrifolia]
MAISGVVKFTCFFLVCMVVASPYTEAAITCGQVVSKLSPCLGYLRNGGTVAPGCCNSIKALNAAAKTTPDRQAACSCLKSAYNSVSGIKLALASALPSACGVNLPYKISPSIDCSKVR